MTPGLEKNKKRQANSETQVTLGGSWREGGRGRGGTGKDREEESARVIRVKFQENRG